MIKKNEPDPRLAPRIRLGTYGEGVYPSDFKDILPHKAVCVNNGYALIITAGTVYLLLYCSRLKHGGSVMDYSNFWRMDNYSHSDLGAAERLNEMMRAGEMVSMMYVEDEKSPDVGDWLGYTGIVWAPISNEYMKMQVDKMVAMVLQSAKNAYFALKKQMTEGTNKPDSTVNDEKSNAEMETNLKKIWKEIVGPAEKFAQHYNSQAGVNNVIKAFRRKAPHCKGYKHFDADDFKINVINGYLDLRTGKLEPHSTSHMCRKCMNASFGTVDDDFYTNVFLPFMITYFPNLETTFVYFAKLLGYCLTGDTSEQKLFFLYGSGKNGKSAITNLILYTWGDYGGVVPTGALLSSKGDGAGEAPSPMIDRLEGMRLVLAHEIPASMRKLNEEKVKTLTGDAVITTRTLNKGGHEWLPKMKIFLDLNDMPEISDPTAVSLRRRIRAIPFRAKFDGNSAFMHMERDVRYRDALLRFAVEGLQQRGTSMLDNWTGEWDDAQGLPKDMLEALREYYENSDTVTPFLTEFMKISKNGNDFVSVSRMYQYYCEENGKAMTVKSFGMKLNQILPKYGCTPAIRYEGLAKRRGWAGIKERTANDCDAGSGLQDTDGNNVSDENSTGCSVSVPETDLFADD